MSVFPSQKISLKEKLKVDETTGKSWGNKCIDFLIENSDFNTDNLEIRQLKAVVDGHIDESLYNHVLNPLNTTLDKYKRFGAKLRSLNILSPVKDLYLGEFGKRFKNIQVMETNAGDDNLYKQGLNLTVKNYYTQQAINELNALGINVGRESKEQPPLKGVIEEYTRDFDANRVITGQETLDFIKFDKELDDKYQDLYEDWIICGRAVSYKGISHNDIDFEPVKAEEFSFPKDDTHTFLEDKAWAVRRTVHPIHSILDKFHDVLDEDTKEFLNKKLSDDGIGLASNTRFVVLPTQYLSANQKFEDNIGVQHKDGLELFHVVWRSWQKVGMLMYIDAMGQVQTMKVDETYVLDKENGDISIEWDWISEVWEGYRIEDTEHYFNIRPLPYNRMALNNSSLQKLPYNGRVMLNTDGTCKSIIKTGIPYQILYNIVSYQREKTINKNKDKISIIPQGLIPKGVNGWDEEKFMYFAHSNSWMIVDETSPTASLALQGLKVLDVGLGTYINDMTSLLQSIKFDWWEAIGMNRQRYGDTKASDGKGITEQAIFRSAIISEELNRKFEKFQEKDYAGLLDLSKLAYINGKKGKYINSEQREAFLSINPDDAIKRLESEFGVFVRNSSEEFEKLKGLKDFAFAYAQNGGGPTMFMEMLDVTNFTKGKEVINKLEILEKEREERMAQQNNEAMKEIEASKAATEAAKLERDKYKVDKEYDKAIDVELLKQSGTVANNQIESDANKNGKDDIQEMKMNDHEIRMDYEKLKLDKKEQERKERETNARVKALASNSNNSK